MYIGINMAKKAEVTEFLEQLKNLRGTAAGQKAQELDAADGTKDGKIQASIWNQYAKEHGGNTVQNYIEVNDAMNSITTYVVRENANNEKQIKEKIYVLLQSEPNLVKELKNDATKNKDSFMQKLIEEVETELKNKQKDDSSIENINNESAKRPDMGV